MLQCSFCGREEQPHLPLIEGVEGSICKECAETVNEEFADFVIPDKQPKSFKKPHEIKEELDKFVIGQDEAKKILAVGVYNHYKRIHSKSKVDIQKTNIMMIGPSGSGKTYLLQTLAKILDVPLVIADATSLTEAGYVGEDVESIIEKLLIKAGGDIEKAEKGIVYIDEIDKLASANPEGSARAKDVGGQGVQEALLKLIEDSELQVSVGNNLYNRRKMMVNTKNILFVCGGAFVGLDKIIEKRRKKHSNTIGFSAVTSSSAESHKETSPQVSQDDLIQYGLIPELVGRIPLITSLNPLTKEDLSHILTKPKNAITKQYKELFKMDGVKLKFHHKAIDYIAEEAIQKKVGARGLRGVIEKQMNELMFNLPRLDGVQSFTITKEMLMGLEPMTPKSESDALSE